VSTWQDRPDASGLWWVRREDHRDTVVHVDASPEGVWINRGGEGWCSVAEYDGAQWCRVVAPDTHAEIVRERDHYRERAAEHHRRGDEARHEAATLRRRLEALESAMREVCDAHRVELIGPPGLSGAACDWCYPGGGATREWPCANAECPVGRALAVLRGATVAAS
jgi:hypothetical protein